MNEQEQKPVRYRPDYTQSNSIVEIAKALVKVQAAMPKVYKDQDNPFFKSKYADLGSIWDAIRGPLTKNGLSIIQLPAGDGLTTTMLHTSGEWISSTMNMHVFTTWDKKTEQYIVTPQAQGSAITYARRYMLAAVVGICPVDDDGESAMVRNGGEPDWALEMAAKVKVIGGIGTEKALEAYWKQHSHEITPMPDNYRAKVISAMKVQRKKLKPKQEEGNAATG